jgi:peptide subunit release factor 1 (eRF1)
MFTHDDLQELLDFSAGDESRVISVYLDTDTTHRTLDQIKLELRALLKDAGENQADDLAAIERYFEYTFPWTDPGAAVFSCAAQDFFRAYPTSISFRNRLRLSRKPHVKPLVHLLDHYAHYGVIVVDRVGAKMFEYHLGECQTSDGYMGEDVRKQKHGTGSSVQGMRGGQGEYTEEMQVLRNMREAAAYAGQFFNGRDIRRLFIAGTTANVAQFKDELPRKLQSCFAGSFPMDMDAGEPEVRRRSLELLTEINQKRENQLVGKMVSLAAQGSTAVVGLAPTLRMISEGRVDTLIISDGYRMPGFVHEDSGYITAGVDEEMFADSNFVQTADVVEKAVARTLEFNGQVEFVSDNKQLEEAGRIGALLRY